MAAWPRSADRPERRQAAAWLTEMLAHGPIEAQRLFDECHQCRLSQRTVRRAAAELGLHPIKIGQGGPWLWGFDNGAAPSALDPPVVQDVAALPEAGNLADSAVMQVELRSDAAPNVAAFEPVGNLPSSAPPAPDVPHYAAAPNVAAVELVGNLPNSAEPESSAIVLDDGDSDGFDNLILDERPWPKAPWRPSKRARGRRRASAHDKRTPAGANHGLVAEVRGQLAENANRPIGGGGVRRRHPLSVGLPSLPRSEGRR